jgi:acetyltransferase-like isoleucine patch superfamily enzyme
VLARRLSHQKNRDQPSVGGHIERGDQAFGQNAGVTFKQLRGRFAARRHALVWRAVHWGWREFQQAGMITSDTPAGMSFRRFGRGSIMAFPAGAVYGENWITVGEGTMIGALVTISAGLVPGQDLGPDPVLRIGDRCVIGRGSHIVAHADIRIGDDVWTGPYVYITDQNHGYADPDMPIGRQMPVNNPVEIGAGSWLGTGAIVLPGARIGRNVVVAAGSVVRGEVPDYCVVAGVPAKVVRSRSEAGWTTPSEIRI